MAKIDLSGLYRRVDTMRDGAMAALFENALRDSQMYCLFFQGPLRSSGEMNSRCSGPRAQLVWATPYARRRYYEPSHARTPGTTFMWFEAAKSNHLADWVESAKKGMGT